jgi:hypothetical protein
MTPIFNTDLPDVFFPLVYDVQPEDIGHELVWYVDPVFFPDRCRVWTINTGDRGIKRMGHVTPYLSKELDVVFIQYDEPNADDNWVRLKELCPRASRVMGIKGIYNAHQAASYIAKTDMFYVVDADSYILDFNFKFTPNIFDRNCVHIFKARNPVNGLEYGNGAVKIIPKNAFTGTAGVDVTTSLGPVKLIDQVISETRFNTSPFSAWRAGFRECAKLSNKVIQGQLDKETEHRLMTWTTVGQDKPFGLDTMKGAYHGCAFTGDLTLINDYNWLKEEYER